MANDPKEEIRRLKKQLREEKAKNSKLEREKKNLKKESTLQKHVIEGIEEINAILANDEQGKDLLWTTNFPHNLPRETAKKIQEVVKKKEKKRGWQFRTAEALGSNRQRVAQVAKQVISDWKKGDTTPKKNGNQCTPAMEALVVALCKEDPDASYNLTAKHAASIVMRSVSANLVKGVRKRNGLAKRDPEKAIHGKIRSNYSHVVSMDVVRVEGEHIFGLIRDGSKLVYHYHSSAQTSEEAVNGLKNYIEQYGKPEAVRCDNGSEFKKDFEEFLKKERIVRLSPLPYNPKANGFIERYFRTLRKDLFRKLRKKRYQVTQEILDDFAFLWNHCSILKSKGKTPAELEGIEIKQRDLDRLKIELKQVYEWQYWHIRGVDGLLNAYLPKNAADFDSLKERQKIA